MKSKDEIADFGTLRRLISFLVESVHNSNRTIADRL